MSKKNDMRRLTVYACNTLFEDHDRINCLDNSIEFRNDLLKKGSLLKDVADKYNISISTASLRRKRFFKQVRWFKVFVKVDIYSNDYEVIIDNVKNYEFEKEPYLFSDLQNERPMYEVIDEYVKEMLGKEIEEAREQEIDTIKEQYMCIGYKHDDKIYLYEVNS